jgi:predicted DCC family thiol-disulfide oxidoreductase YuxK
MTTPTPGEQHAVVLFDGVCNLCNSSVNFIIDRDRKAYFQFAPLQSEYAARLLGDAAPKGEPGSILLWEGGHLYSHSTAALRIARRLDGVWKLGAVGMIAPRPLRDAVYRWIARNRYRWFGRTEACRRPTPALRARFLE